MRIVKGINNNAALAVDENGKELVVFGRGVGFPSSEHELKDASVIVKRFYDVDTSLLTMVASLPEDVLALSADIVDAAHAELGCKLNPNLTFTLADHLAFAIERTREGIELDNPLAAQIGLVYPRETAIGKQAIALVCARTDVELPAAEAHAMALHLVNAEADAKDGSSMGLVIKSTRIIEDIIGIVESFLGATIDRESYPYMRFTTHLRFLIGRLQNQEAPDADTAESASVLFERIATDFPKAAECAKEINAYLIREFDWCCSNEELLYLVLHTNRFISGQ